MEGPERHHGTPPHTHVSLVHMLLLDAGYTQADKDGLVWKPADSAAEKDHVRLHPVTSGSQLAALVAGQGDLGVVDEPDASNGVAQGYEIVFSFPQHFGPFFYTSIATANRTIQRQPDVVQRFVNAMTKAMLFGHKYPERAAEVAAQRYYTSDATMIVNATKRIISDEAYPKNMVVNKEAYEKNFHSLLARTNHPAAKFPFGELMDLRFAETAAGQLSFKDV